MEVDVIAAMSAERLKFSLNILKMLAKKKTVQAEIKKWMYARF